MRIGSRKVDDAGHGVPRLLDDADALLALMESLQERIIVADTDFNIAYINPLGLRALHALEEHIYQAFKVKVADIVSGSIHRFHRDPARVERVLANAAGLPRDVSFSFGPITLTTRINGIVLNGTKLGYVVTFEDVTERLLIEEAEARVTSMMHNSPTNMMYADKDMFIRYMNPASLNTLRTLQAHLPVPVDQLIGTNIDVFHKHPAHQRAVFEQHAHRLPMRSVIHVGPEALDLNVSAITDKNGQFIGAMATWQVISKKVQLEHETGRVSEALAAAAEELQVVSTQMGANSAETSKKVNLVTQASAEVSRNVETVSAGAEEMSVSMREIARNAADAADVAAQAVEAARTTNETIAQLGGRSAEIGEIIKVITGIAQQTNLLALNATIEAARAGEAGKGFAVVANEVKELAKETARATEDISEKIAGIQAATDRSVEAIAGIMAIINRLAEYQGATASAVEEQAATTAEITRSLHEASRRSAEITTNMQAVAEAANSTAAGASDSQQAATELARMSADLQALVARGSD